MARLTDLSIAGYGGYRGVYFRGSVPMPTVRPSDPVALKWLAVVTATEGGRLDAFNGYDRCGVSTGLVQLCEFGLFLTSALLGDIRMGAPAAMTPIDDYMSRIGASFKIGAGGKWRFFSGGQEVKSLVEQQVLFLGCDGKAGSWTDPVFMRAKQWACAITDTLAHPEAREVQMSHVSKRLPSFVVKEAYEALDFAKPARSNRYAQAARALYLSYSANLPALAWKQLKLHLEATGGVPDPMTEDWVNGLALILAYGTTVGIWPERLERIREPIERLFAVRVVDLREKLAEFRASLQTEGQERLEAFRQTCGVPGYDCPHDLATVQGLQEALVSLGYDLGPAGADGIWGPKSAAATRHFQDQHGLDVDGIVGPKTRVTLGLALIEDASHRTDLALPSAQAVGGERGTQLRWLRNASGSLETIHDHSIQPHEHVGDQHVFRFFIRIVVPSSPVRWQSRVASRRAPRCVFIHILNAPPVQRRQVGIVMVEDRDNPIVHHGPSMVGALEPAIRLAPLRHAAVEGVHARQGHLASLLPHQ